MNRAIAAGAALLAAGLCPPLLAAKEEAAIAPIVAFQQLETRLYTTGWSLVRANARHCAKVRSAIGLQLHDTATYGAPAAVREQLGLRGDIGVQAVAPGSPAAAAGLATNDTLLRLGDRDIATMFPPTKPTWQRLLALEAAMAAALDQGPVTLAWAKPDGAVMETVIAGVPACETRFELLDSANGPAADGTRVVMGTRFAGFDWSEDEFAAAVAHELAHNLLGHRAVFDRTGRKQSLVRLSERDADRLMPWILQNAGYDPRAAVRFMERWGPRFGGWIFRARTHDGWDERAAHIEAEIAAMQLHIGADGSADWSRHFRQELAAALPR